MKDKYIPLYFVAFFAVVFAVNGVFVYKAVSTHTGVVNDNAYEEGRAYNDVIAAQEEQEKLGWGSKISLVADAVKFELLDRDGSAIKGAEVFALISRPMKAEFDKKIKLLENAEGEYSAQVNFPLKGQWQIEVLAKWQGQNYQKSKRVIVQ